MTRTTHPQANNHQSQPLCSVDWDIEVFYDGDCPLCGREIAMLRRRDRAGRIQFTNIADVDFDPSVTGKSITELMKEIHGRLPSGQVINGVEVFRRLYAAIGYDWLVEHTRYPVVSQMLDAAYHIFARFRLRLVSTRCDGGSCKKA